jgi:hypothetical protein
MNTFTPKFDKLDDAQKKLWPDLAAVADSGFVLYGGTGLSLRLGHRFSVDFDFFSDAPLNKRSLRASLPFLTNAQTLLDEADSLTILASAGEETVKVSFFGRLGIGRVAEPDYTEDGVCMVASPLDLCATKLKVIFDRIEAKDYRDILAIVSSGLPIEEGLAAARAIYGAEFQPAELLKALTYFEGGDLDQLTKSEREELIKISASVESIPEIVKLSEHLAGRFEGHLGGRVNPRHS